MSFADDFTALTGAPSWPLTRLYHENSKLSQFRSMELREQMSGYLGDREAVQRSADAFKPYPTRPIVELPRASRRLGRHSLFRILRSRRTHRGAFGSRPMTAAQLGHLLDVSCGITGRGSHPEFPEIEQEFRAWPSGGALYPIELYAIALSDDESAGISPAIYHYQPLTHRLARINELPSREQLEQIVIAGDSWSGASALLVLTGVFARTQQKYGERGYRIVLLDAGHLAQNLLLASEDINVAAVPLGGFDDDRLAELLQIDPQEEAPLHLVILGSKPEAHFSIRKLVARLSSK